MNLMVYDLKNNNLMYKFLKNQNLGIIYILVDNLKQNIINGVTKNIFVDFD